MQSVLTYIVFCYLFAGVVRAESHTGKDAALERKSTIIAFPRYRFLKIVSESAMLVDERGVDK